ncbi:MAG: ArsR family transcriptional regulator [Rhodospirillaceae bacterium]|nr:ArsR family transcriptional regulator [Rhodospirillaceae bacterium]
MFDLDRTDFEIVRLLQNDGRMSNKSLAAEVGLAPSSCLERVRRLRDTGVIRGIHAAIDPTAMGVGLQAIYALELAKHQREVVETFQADVLRMPEVMAVYLVSGAFDFLVHVAVRDAQHLRDLALDSFTHRPEVTRLQTTLVFDYACRHELPCYRDRDGRQAPVS